jgi:hypothetical protein
MSSNRQVAGPDVLLLVSTNCPHCHNLQSLLEDCLSRKTISRLDVINIEQDAEPARQYGVRSVPWMRMGAFELEGGMTPAELDRWIELSHAPDGITIYIDEQLKQGRLDKLLPMFKSGRLELDALLPLLADVETPISVRLGMAAIAEDMEGTSALQALEPALVSLAGHENPTLRMDACHYLSLMHTTAGIAVIEGLLEDENMQVREAAQDCLEDSKALH